MRGNPVLEEILVSLVFPVEEVSQVRMGLQVSGAVTGPEDSKVHLEDKETPVTMVGRESQAVPGPRVGPAHTVLRATLALRARTADTGLQVLLVIPVQQVLLGLLGQQVGQVPLDLAALTVLRDRKVHRDPMDLLVLLVLKVRVVWKDKLDCLDPLVRLDPLEIPDLKEKLVLLVQEVPLVTLERPEEMERLDLQVSQDLKATPGVKEHRVPEGRSVCRVLLDQQDCKGSQVILVPLVDVEELDLKVPEDPPENKVLLVVLVWLVPQDQRENPVLRVRMVELGQLDQSVLEETLVPKGTQDLEVRLVRREVLFCSPTSVRLTMVGVLRSVWTRMTDTAACATLVSILCLLNSFNVQLRICTAV